MEHICPLDTDGTLPRIERSFLRRLLGDIVQSLSLNIELPEQVAFAGKLAEYEPDLFCTVWLREL